MSGLGLERLGAENAARPLALMRGHGDSGAVARPCENSGFHGQLQREVSMHVTTVVWAATIAALLVVIFADLIIVDRRPHPFTAKDATRWVLFYVALALAFAGVVTVVWGGEFAGQFLAGYITEYSLSVDNLFVFMVIMASFEVPEAFRHRVLLVGVLIALLLRGLLITLGAAAIARFDFTFFVFGAFLLWTAATVWRSDDEPDPDGNALIRFVEKRVPATREYHGTALFITARGRRMITPMALVMLAIGTTDLLFALDSIPAVFGLTREPYLVFAANAFALMGLRQLYFMLHGALSRLVYLNKGLALVLGFIAVKLVLHASRQVFGWPIPEISIVWSLLVILSILIATTALSLVAVRRHPELAGHAPQAVAEEEAREHTGEALGHLPAEEN
ncbi:MAG: TerC/Alx family metal homeostasis membrane protein [Candidatus Nanopelagicales bacterium]